MGETELREALQRIVTKVDANEAALFSDDPEMAAARAALLAEPDRGFRVPVRLLRCEWPPNDGVQPGDPQFDALFDSIRDEGVREPLTINLAWRVIDGAHRLNAARLLGIETVPVRVWTETEFVG